MTPIATRPRLARHPRAGLPLAVLGTLLAVASAHGVQISLDPGTASRSTGQSVSLAIGVGGLGDGTALSLGAFDLTARFDPAVLAFDSIAFGDPALGNQLGPIFGSVDGFAVDGVAGTLNFFSVSLDSAADLDALQAPQFLLGTLEFLTIGPGFSDVVFDTVILGDADGSPFDAVAEGARITVSDSVTVPEGGGWSAGLLLMGLAASSFWARRLSGDAARV